MQYQLYRDFLQSEIIRTQAEEETVVLTDLSEVDFDQTEAQDIIGTPYNRTTNESWTPLEQAVWLLVEFSTYQ